MDFRLERLTPVLEHLGNPERAVPVLHVAGTNGKGSTAAMMHSIYLQAGYNVGLYTSPHLLSFRERIRCGEQWISCEQVVAHVTRVRRAMEQAAVELTFFEISTIIAFLEFSRCRADLAIIETGLGGRLDATNVAPSRLAMITSVDLDHEQYLGSTISEIAAEKAGIIKPGALVVSGPLRPEALEVVGARVAACASEWMHFGRDFDEDILRSAPEEAMVAQAVAPVADETAKEDGAAQAARTQILDAGGSGGQAQAERLPGPHQRRNAALAVAAVAALGREFPVAGVELAAGLRATRWPGRMERISSPGGPEVILDAAHNPAAVDCLGEALDAMNLGSPRVAVFGVMRDKQWVPMLQRLLAAVDRVLFTRVAQSRSLDPFSVDESAPEFTGVDWERCQKVPVAVEALDRARAAAGGTGVVVVTGSIFLVAQLYRDAGAGPHPLIEDDIAA